MRKAPISIKPKIFLYLIGFCALLLVLLWLLQTVFLEGFYKAIKQREVASAARSIGSALEAGDDTLWQSDVLDRGDLYVELWNEATGPRPVSGNMPQGYIMQLAPFQKEQLLQEARTTGSFVQVEGEAPPEPLGLPPGLRKDRTRESILYAGLVTYPDGSEDLLIVSAEITPVNATVQTLRVQLVFISIFMMLLAAGIAWFISRRVARPIQKLNTTAAGWGSGEYDVHFEGGGYSEADQLADTLNQAAAELRKTETLQRELVANVGHDLRTPLTLIEGYAEMIRDIPGEDTAENMQVIIDETHRLGGLVSDLMDFSRLQAGTVGIEPRPLNLTVAIESILLRFSRLAEAEGYTTTFTHTGDVWVNADETRIAQVVYNFIINAMVHTGEDKRIAVSLVEGGNRVAVEVRDSGPGIPAAQLPYIWQRYYTSGESHKRAATGSGLGLAIAKSILDQHPGAEYGARSSTKGGSVFWFSLPVLEK